MGKAKGGLGDNPLDLVVPAAAHREETGRELGRDGAKARATFHLPEDLVEELRDAVVFLSGPPLRLTMARAAEIALARELERLRLEHNGGRPFPRRDSDLRGGRPVG